VEIRSASRPRTSVSNRLLACCSVSSWSSYELLLLSLSCVAGALAPASLGTRGDSCWAAASRERPALASLSSRDSVA
jgi:hypothetical protein